MEKTINLKKRPDLLKQYIKLRNKYINKLLSSRVFFDDTIRWLAKTNVEIYGIVKNNKILIGVIIIYIEKDNEICFFTKEPGKGVGSRLLKVADRIARARQLKHLWAWTNIKNIAAINAFKKGGYVKTKEYYRKFNERKIMGCRFVKNFPDLKKLEKN